MATRAIQGRIECDSKTMEALWRTHRVFNDRLPTILSWLFKMRRGECGRSQEESSLYQTIARYVLANSQNADYLLNSVSKKNWAPGSAKKKKKLKSTVEGKNDPEAENWADHAAALSAEGRLLYDKKAVLFDLPETIRQMVCRDAAAIINGHGELIARWEQGHADWLKRKAEWESNEENKLYLALRPQFGDFEEKAGKVGKRRGRWHLYLDWLRANPSLAGWRGGAAVVAELPPHALARIRKAKPSRQRSVEAEEFWKGNPELAALDRLHGFYEREFVRRRKTKKNADGFQHRPTFTLPHPTRHPRWFVFNGPRTSPHGYWNLKLPATPGEQGSVDLLLVTGDETNGKYPTKRVRVEFRGDPRLAAFRPIKKTRTVGKGQNKGQTAVQDSYEFFDRHLGKWRPAEIKGIKLIFRLNPDGSPKSAYLYFTCSLDDLPLTDHAKAIQWTETGEVTKKGKKRKTKRIPDGLVACAVDLGIRNLGFATLARYGKGALELLRSRNLWLEREEAAGRHPGRWSAGADLAHIGRHKRTIRNLRRKRGKPVKGEDSHVELQEHIDNMGEDRFKQAARAILNFSLNTDQSAGGRTGEVYPRADVLVLERLPGLIPDAERERGINRALVSWNRGQLVTRVKEMAQDLGLKVFEVSPVGTSQVCSRCGALGRRYTVIRDDETKRFDIRFGPVEKLFACPNPQCGYRANSDHNASVNLHRRFSLEDSAVRAYLDWSDKTTPKAEKAAKIWRIEESLRPALLKMHGLEEPTPF